MGARSMVVLFAFVCACAKEAPIVEVKGECAAAHQAQLCTWARMQEGTVVAVGLTVPIASIENAPGDQPMVWPPPRIATFLRRAGAADSICMSSWNWSWKVSDASYTPPACS